MFIKLSTKAGPKPERATKHSAGYDLRAVESFRLHSGQRHMFGTGYGWSAVPNGLYGRISPRSGLAVKGIDVLAGTVDGDYRAEIKVILINHGDRPVDIEPGDRIAQLILTPYATFGESVETERDGGFGSTGRQRVIKTAQPIKSVYIVHLTKGAQNDHNYREIH